MEDEDPASELEGLSLESLGLSARLRRCRWLDLVLFTMAPDPGVDEEGSST